MSDLVKSLTELIDETLAEIETLKKGRFDAEEIDLGDDKANGEMVAKKEDEDKEEDKEDEKAEKAEDKKDCADKDHKHDIECKVVKADDEEEEDEEDEEFKKAEEAFKAACAKRDMKKAEKKGVNVEKMEEVKKSIDARIQPIEARLEEITSLVKKLADSPVPARGSTFKSIQPLAKSEESQPLSKSKVLDDLVNLKKSGKPVASEDVFRVELGGLSDLEEIATKYGIK
jgi:hypothetical protein